MQIVKIGVIIGKMLAYAQPSSYGHHSQMQILTKYNTTVRKRCELLALIMLVICAFMIPVSVSATTITYLLAWILVLISGDWPTRWHRIKTNPAAISFWILFCLFLIGLINTSSTWAQAATDLHKRHWLMITPFFMMIINDDCWRRRVLNAFLWSMVFTLFLVLLKYAGFDIIGILLNKHRPEGNIFFEHIVQNFFLSIAAFVFGYRALFHETLRPLNGILFLLMTCCVLFLSASRTGYVAMVLLIAYLALLKFRAKGLLIGALSGVLLLTAAWFGSITFRNSIKNIPEQYQRYQHGDTMTSVGQRVGMWENALTLIRQRPLLGYGTGGIRDAMQQHLSQQEINRSGLANYVESSPVNFLLQFGIIGFCVFLLMIGLQIYTSLRIVGEYRHLMQGFLLAFLAGSLFNSFFVSFCEAHLYSLFAAVCFGNINKERPHA